MQGNKDSYSRYFVNKKSDRRRKRVVFQFNWLRILVFLLIICAFVLSVTLIAVYSKNEIKFNRKAFYFLQLHEYDELDIAQKAASNVKSDGGAGFVLISDKFRVMAFVYPDEDSCSKVAARLNESGENAVVYKYEFGDRYLTGYDDKEKTKKMQSYINNIFYIFDKLFEACVNLDKETISESLAIREANLLFDLAEMCALNLKTEDQSNRADRLKKIFTELSACISKGLNVPGTDKVSQHLKNTLCNVAVIIKDNVENLV